MPARLGEVPVKQVSVREVGELAELENVVLLFNSIWGEGRPPVSLELLRALTKAGNYVGGAYLGERLIGACVGFFHQPSDGALHSHVAGVESGFAGRSVGFALKQHQREWAAARGISEISWTYDPLVSRNAHFNLVKLGARAVEYLPNFYGSMSDKINGADDSDRLLVHWAVRDPSPVQSFKIEDGAVALGRDADNRPQSGSLDGLMSLVAVPTDIAALRRADPGLAQEWRLAVREVLTTLLADGGQITGFDRNGLYLVTRTAKGTPR